MKTLDFEILSPIKLPLVQRFYKNNYPSSKPKKDDIIVVGRQLGNIIAATRFRHIEQNLLLTGMCVTHSLRRTGIGDQLLHFCSDRILSDSVYCFAYTHLEHFYAKHHFEKIDANELPDSLKLLYRQYTRYGKSLMSMRHL